MNLNFAPSLLSADFSRLATEVQDVEKAGADLLHLDIMDGHFVPNLTFGPLLVRSLSQHCTIPLDVHLMVTEPDDLIDELAAAKVARIAVHVEACVHLHRTLQRIRDAGISTGVAINPASALCLLEDTLPWVDFVVVMSVNPGFGGQAFIPESLDKIRRLRTMAENRRLDITVDGGVGPTNVGDLVAAGATTLVAGSSVLGEPDRAAALKRLRSAATAGETV
jgi:ribulose-phosphate 3-epimerase